jgi:hypothetical protein
VFNEEYSLYEKTTIAAIADTCDMSPGNVYQFNVTEVTSTDVSVLPQYLRVLILSTAAQQDAVKLTYVISTNQPFVTYSSLTSMLSNGVEDGAFDDNLADEAGSNGATLLQQCTSSSVDITYIAGTLTSTEKTYSFRIASAVVASSIGILICIIVAMSYYSRSFSREHLESTVDDAGSLAPTILMKAVSASMVLYQLIVIEDNGKYFLLLLSRGLEFSGWLLFMYMLLVPPERTDPNSQPNVNMVPLSLKLHGPAVGYGMNVVSAKNACGFRSLAMTTNILLILLSGWDVTLVLLLPWTRTSTTELLNGYPSMSTCRICLYTPLATQTIQLIYSIFLLLNSKNDFGNYIFEAATFLYWFYSVLRTVLFLQFSRNEELDLAVVNIADLRKFASSDAFHVTLMSSEDVSSIRRYLEEKTMETMRTVDGTPIEGGRGSDIGLEMSLHQKPGDADVQVSMDVIDAVSSGKPSAVSESLKGFDDGENIDFQEIVEVENLQEYKTAIPFADETNEILKNQLIDAGVLPLTYIPKEQLQKEINELVAAANSGIRYDEGRLDYLLRCLDVNPEYQVALNC